MSHRRDDAAPGWVLHVDLDEFIAAVEVLRRPELAGRPVVVGGRGDPTERGVVSTASYAARASGLRSGMPLRTAARKCPDAVFLPVDHDAYDEASAAVMAALRGLGVPVQVLGWDEAFLAVRTFDPVAYAEHVRATVLAATGLHCSVGVGENKLQAKTATGYAKPQGVFTITSRTWSDQLGSRPTDALWGIGRRTAARLGELGLHTVAELAAADAAVLAERLGPTMGPWYRRLARGVDASPVDPTPYVARGHGREVTFQQDETDWDRVADTVRRLAAHVAADLAAEARPAVRVGLKVRFVPFETRSRSRALTSATSDPEAIADAALALLAGLDHARAVRLVGVRAEMAPPVGDGVGQDGREHGGGQHGG